MSTTGGHLAQVNTLDAPLRALGPAMRECTSASFVCEPGRLEAQAVLLAASLRRHHPSLTLVAGVPRALSALTERALDSLRVERVPITNPVADDYPIGNKIAALGAGDTSGLRVFLDSDMLCLRALDFDLLRSHPLAAKPADMATFGSDALWQCLYERFGLSPPSQRVVASIGGQMMYPYFNAGMVATTRASALSPLWAETCRAVDVMHDVNPRRPWLDQIALPLAAARLGLATRSVGDNWNYPAHIKPLRGEPGLVHYHQAAVVAREPALAEKVAGLLLRYPALRPVLEPDAAWSPVLSAIARSSEALSWRHSTRRWFRSASRRPKSTYERTAAHRDLIVTGIPRSGTSYVCRSLDGFDNVAVVNEPAILFEGLGYGPEPWIVPVLHADLRARIDGGEAVQNKLDARGDLTEDTAVHEALASYRPRLRDGDWVLATKNTLAYMARLDGLFRVMPDVRVVACVRHPLDTLASWKGTFAHLASGDPSALPVGGLADPFLPAHLRDGLSNIARLSDPAVRRAAWWCLLAEEILRWRDRIEIVRYEDLVVDPRKHMQRLLGPLSHAAGKPGSGLKPSTIRTARRRQLEDADWRAVASLCAGTAEAFGYDCLAHPDDASDTSAGHEREFHG